MSAPPINPDETYRRLQTAMTERAADTIPPEVFRLWSALDEWLSDGGALPHEWATTTHASHAKTILRDNARPARQCGANTIVVPLSIAFTAIER